MSVQRQVQRNEDRTFDALNVVAACCVDNNICFGSVVLDDSIIFEIAFNHFEIGIKFLKFSETLGTVSAKDSDMESIL